MCVVPGPWSVVTCYSSRSAGMPPSLQLRPIILALAFVLKDKILCVELNILLPPWGNQVVALVIIPTHIFTFQ